jgi:hypothetical protein
MVVFSSSPVVGDYIIAPGKVLFYFYGFSKPPCTAARGFDGDVLGNFGERCVYWNSGLYTEMGRRFISERKPLGCVGGDIYQESDYKSSLSGFGIINPEQRDLFPLQIRDRSLETPY